MRYVKIKVVRDINAQMPTSVLPWEIPILEIVFGQGNVQETGEFHRVMKDPATAYPAAGAEFDRLTRRYGSDPESGVPYVVSAYGTARSGIEALGRAIDAARKADSKAERKAPAPAAPKGRSRRRAVEPDPLTA